MTMSRKERIQKRVGSMLAVRGMPDLFEDPRQSAYKCWIRADDAGNNKESELWKEVLTEYDRQVSLVGQGAGNAEG